MGNIAAGKSTKEIAGDLAKNIGLNAGMNAGAALLGNAGDIIDSVKAKNAAKQLDKSDNMIPRLLEQADASVINDGQKITIDEIRKKIADGTYKSVEDLPLVRLGKATSFRGAKYTRGEVPKQTVINAKRIDIPNEMVEDAAVNLELSMLDSKTSSQSQKTILTKVYESLFGETGEPFVVPVENVSFAGKGYNVTVNKNSVGKVMSDGGLSKEKLAVLDDIDEVIANSDYVGSGEYIEHHFKDGKHKKSQVERYDYFETPVKISGEDYIVSYSVKNESGKNTYRTHKVVNEINLTSSSGGETAGLAAAQDDLSSLFNNPLSSKEPLNTDPASAVKTLENGDLFNGSIVRVANMTDDQSALLRTSETGRGSTSTISIPHLTENATSTMPESVSNEIPTLTITRDQLVDTARKAEGAYVPKNSSKYGKVLDDKVSVTNLFGRQQSGNEALNSIVKNYGSPEDADSLWQMKDLLNYYKQSGDEQALQEAKAIANELDAKFAEKTLKTKSGSVSYADYGLTVSDLVDDITSGSKVDTKAFTDIILNNSTTQAQKDEAWENMLSYLDDGVKNGDISREQATDIIRQIDKEQRGNSVSEIPVLKETPEALVQDIPVLKNTPVADGELKARSYDNKTLINKTDMPDEVKNEFINNPDMYNVLSDKTTKETADRILANNSFDGAYVEFSDMLSAKNPAAIPLGYDLAKQAAQNGNTTMAVDIVESMSKSLMFESLVNSKIYKTKIIYVE